MTNEEKRPEEEKKPKERKKRKGRLRAHGTGSIFRRPERKGKQWVAQLVLENGKTRQRYFKTQEEAADALNEMLYEQKRGTLITEKDQTIKKYLEYWLEDIHKPSIRDSSYSRYRTYVYKHIIPVLGHIQLQSLKPQHVQTFYAQKQAEGLSSKTIMGIHGLLHNALKNAVRWELISRNVCDSVTPPRVVKPEIQPLTIEQVRRLLKQAQGHRLEVLLTVAIVTGMRRGELLGLRWQDINFSNNSLQVCRTVNHITRYGFVITEPKTAKGRRKIILPPFVIEMLKQHRSRQEEVKAQAGTLSWQNLDLVFGNVYGGYQNPNHLLQRFHKLMSDAGLPHMRFHNLRHSAATILLSKDVNPKVIQELLGHSQISMTLDIYSHVLPSMQRDTMNKWKDLLEGDDEEEEPEDNEEDTQ